MDTQELVAGDIWSITVSSSTSTEVYYVLEATCEVIGRPPPHSSTSAGSSAQGLPPLRADWSAYINTQSSSSPVKAATFSLMSQLKWINHEEYDKGISRVWLKRIQDEGELGAAKRAVAGKYVLACIVANRHVHATPVHINSQTREQRQWPLDVIRRHGPRIYWNTIRPAKAEAKHACTAFPTCVCHICDQTEHCSPSCLDTII